MICRVSALWLGCALLAARGHDFWMEARPWMAAPGGAVEFRLYLGEVLQVEEERPFAAPGLQRWLLLGGGRTNDLRLLARGGIEPPTCVPLAAPGTYLAVQERGPFHVTLEPAEFEKYLVEEGLEAVRDQRRAAGLADRPGRERYRRHLKAILQAGDAADDAATQPVGQRLEIVPLTPPARLRTGDRLAARVLWEGRPLAGVLVTLGQRPGDTVTRDAARSDARGEVAFTVRERGLSILRGVHMQPATDTADADWDSFWAAVTFAVP